MLSHRTDSILVVIVIILLTLLCNSLLLSRKPFLLSVVLPCFSPCFFKHRSQFLLSNLNSLPFQSQIGALICAQSRNSDTVCQPPMEWEPGVHTVSYSVSVCPVFPYPRHLPGACSNLQVASSSLRITEGPSLYLMPTPVTSYLVCSFCLSSLSPI